MNPSTQLRNTAGRRGIALVIVLSMLVLITALIIGFTSSVSVDLTSTQSYANSAAARQLGESAVNLVMAQIAQGATSSGSATWTSQPGMIRTYSATGNGAPGNFYKLYSSDAMVVPGARFDASSEAPAANWNTQTAIYTDLNSPVLISDTNGKIAGVGGDTNTYTASFPIIDGNNPQDVTPANPPKAGANYWTYSTSATSGVEGFYFEKPSTYNNNPAQISASNNPAPMPVKWLYVLRQGQIVAPTATGDGKTADFSTAATKPSSSNPIVGRIAFWTDDDSCKININTAAGDEKLTFPIDIGTASKAKGVAFGPFWDTPRTQAMTDLGSDSSNQGSYVPGLGWSQPFTNEFQRYPGHPATVALNTVFPSITRAGIGGLIPRIQDGGSKGGTLQMHTDSPSVIDLSLDRDRLYASVDELMFKPVSSGSSRALTDATLVTKQKLEQAKFFLTAGSRTPDLNLFGQPRVTIWPIGDTKTSFDKLIAFCSTVGDGNATGSRPYYFGRLDSTSTTADYANIPRNQTLYRYLQNLTSNPIPGFGAGTFSSKYGTDRDQILTEIFDYIRCTNLIDPNSDAKIYTQPKGTAGAGLVAPISIGSTRGFGRFPTFNEVAVQFYVCSSTSVVTTSGSTNYPTGMKAVLLASLFHPMCGYAGVLDDLDVTCTFSGQWSVTVNGQGNSASLGFPSGPVTTHVAMTGDPTAFNERGLGGEAGPLELFQNSGKKTLGQGDAETQYPFYGSAIVATGTNRYNTFTFAGGTVRLSLAHHANPSQIIQTVDIQFPASKTVWPIPQIPPFASTENLNYLNYDWRTTGRGVGLIDSNDTTLGMEAIGAGGVYSSSATAPYGDLRLVALNSTIPSNWFQPHIGYANMGSVNQWSGDPTPHFAMGLRPSKIDGPDYYGPLYNQYRATMRGSLVPVTGGNTAEGIAKGPGYGDEGANPVIPAGIIDVGKAFAGDFDNGIGNLRDGPYINKADEGVVKKATNGSADMYDLPYFANESSIANTSFFSPNRQMASPVMFGSLPSQPLAQKPWQTLLFRPDPQGKHYGSNTPKDHLLLDLFTMPVVDPYAISEPFSTAGRINMNYQIMPFGTSIVRETALRSVLKSTWVMAIPTGKNSITGNGYAKDYKNPTVTTGKGLNFRYPIDLDTTLRQFTDRFANGTNRNFVSASEICDIDLYPGSLSDGKSTGSGIGVSYDASGNSMQTFWSNNRLTGDNTREMPYNHLYPLLTTKSNTFTIHMRVQALKQVPSGRTDWTQWIEGEDKVMGEYRGATTIERYLDPNDKRFTPGNAGYLDPDTQSLDTAYKFHVIGVKEFAP